MRKLVQASLLALTAAAAVGVSGCATIGSSQATYTNATGEAWYVQTTGFSWLQWDPHVFFCPTPSSGPAQCTEAKMVPQAAAAK